jgi:hypothetical protein
MALSSRVEVARDLALGIDAKQLVERDVGVVVQRPELVIDAG